MMEGIYRLKLYDAIKLETIYLKLRQQNLPSQIKYKLVKFFTPVRTETEQYRKDLIDLFQACLAQDLKLDFNKSKDAFPTMMELMNKEVNIELPQIEFSVDDFENLDLSFDDFEFLFSYISTK